LNKEILFNYYHKSLDSKQIIEIKEHLDNCESCQHTLYLIINEISITKSSLNYLNPDLKKIPEFRISKNQLYKKKKLEYGQILSWAASICLLIIFSTLTTKKIIHNQKPVNDYEYFEYVPDMNDAFNNQSISITEYNSNGIPINHEIIRN